jgi:hypothetical protein
MQDSLVLFARQRQPRLRPVQVQGLEKRVLGRVQIVHLALRDSLACHYRRLCH